MHLLYGTTLNILKLVWEVLNFVSLNKILNLNFVMKKYDWKENFIKDHF